MLHGRIGVRVPVSHGNATPDTLHTALELKAVSPRLARYVQKEPSPQEWNVYAGGWWLQRTPRIRPGHEWPLILRIQ